MMLFNYSDFSESYLNSNFAPLYHLTTIYGLIEIINSNILKMSEFDNIYQGKNIKMISFTRNKNINLDYYKPFLDIIIELDTNKLKKKYKIFKYDFFIHCKKEDKPKSNIDRKEPFEFEESILSDIDNILDYIISIDFSNDSLLDRSIAVLIPILKNKKIIIYNNGKEY